MARIQHLLLLAPLLLTSLSANDEAVFYAGKVFPILEANCFKCHGGEEKLKGGFRVTSREGLLRGGDYGPSLDETEPARSMLLRMISYESDDHQMPPKAKLPEHEIAILRQWVERGATYDPALEIAGSPDEAHSGFTLTDEQRRYWAYEPVRRPEVPGTADHPVDAFLQARRAGAGLKPNPPADPRELCRRLYYNLIGLPPRLEEVNAFTADAAAKGLKPAVADLVDTLLSRPEYGEKWARHWLDIVRYAESNGFERDNPKPEIWRYRDYVIKAFNEDKPYDRFIIEQLAGDEIAEPTRDSLTATGFHRLMQWDDEPADRKQHTYDVFADNVQMTSEAFLGSTLGCARCHDHKADPFSQKDYYSFMAFFHGVTDYSTGGSMVHWTPPEERELFEKEQDETLARLRAREADLDARIFAFLETSGALDRGPGSPARPFTFVDDARGRGASWSFTTAKPAPEWNQVGFRDKSWIRTSSSGFGTAVPNVPIPNNRWITPEIWLQTSFGLKELPRSLVLEIYHDEDVEVYLNGGLIFQRKGFVTDYQAVPLPQQALDYLQTGRNVIAVHCRQTGGGQFIDLSLRTAPSTSKDVIDVVKQHGGIKKVGNQMKEALGQDLVQTLTNTRREMENLRKRKPGIQINGVAERGPVPAPLHIHLRGSAHAPGDPVEPGFPAVLASDDSDPRTARAEPVTRDGRTTSGRRLALARWIASPDNPLTARVMMNRLWQHHFGRGIVPSSSDFGALGEAPTHPELLTWLAAELMEQGWSLKAMHRLITSSDAYLMSSRGHPEGLDQDPQNHLFWRFNMRRLTAEEIRDSILAVSGKLNREERGGRWVYPPLPAAVLATASRPGKGWPISQREADHFRRSVYVHVKRSLRHPMMADYDQADTDSPCAVRFATTVPTQALSMLNSGFVNEQGAALAARLRQATPGDATAQATAALRLTLQREPRKDEIDHCIQFLHQLREETGLTDEEALDRLALLTLNLNEFIYLD